MAKKYLHQNIAHLKRHLSRGASNDAHTQAQTGQILQQMENVSAEINALNDQMLQTIQGEIDSIPV